MRYSYFAGLSVVGTFRRSCSALNGIRVSLDVGLFDSEDLIVIEIGALNVVRCCPFSICMQVVDYLLSRLEVISSIISVLGQF